MTAISKLYFHDATTGDTGTLPGSGSLSAATPTATATGASTNRAMDANKGASQVSIALTMTYYQYDWYRRFVSAPIAAQTISGTFSVHLGAQRDQRYGTSGDAVVAVWRPSTGALVGRLYDAIGSWGQLWLVAPGTAELALSGGASLSSLAVLDGDILVVELWAWTVYTGQTLTYFYDGTTEDSATSNAAYISFSNAITMYSAAPMIGVRRSSAWVKGAVKVRRSSAWVAPTAVKVRRGGAWTTET